MNQRSTWQRLHDIGEKRRAHIAKRQQDLEGVSPAWVRALPSNEGAPSARMIDKLNAYDDALLWPRGTSFRLARDPFVEGSDTAIDEEDRLVHGDWSDLEATPDPELRQMVEDFSTMVMGTLRGMAEDDRERALEGVAGVVTATLLNMDPASAERTMRDIGRLLGIG